MKRCGRWQPSLKFVVCNCTMGVNKVEDQVQALLGLVLGDESGGKLKFRVESL